MSKKYVSIDAGKYNTKLNAYDPAAGKQMRAKFRTKISDGTFEDDMFEKGTFIVQIDDGPVYKVGRDGRQEPEFAFVHQGWEQILRLEISVRRL